MSSMNGSYPQIVHELNDLRRRWRSARLIEGILLAVAAIVLFAIVFATIDTFLHLPAFGRLLLAVALWAILFFASVRLVVHRILIQQRDDFFAALVEKKHPELSNRLINALQLGRGNEYGSPVIIEAIVQDGLQATEGMDLNDCLDWQPVKRAIAAAAGGTVLIIALLFWPHFSSAFARVLMPLANIAPYSSTLILEDSILPQSGKVAEGTSVVFEVKVDGNRVVPDNATLFRSFDGKRWRPVIMHPRPTDPTTFEHTLSSVNSGFEFYITAGDARSEMRKLDVIRRPRIDNIDITYQFPKYTGQQPQQITKSEGQIAALVGTTVTLEIASSKPLDEAELKTESGELIRFRSTDDPTTWTASFVIWSNQTKAKQVPAGRLIIAPTRYQIRLSDTDGYESANQLWRTIDIIKDQAPSVAITSPARDQNAKLNQLISLVVESKDDYGLDQIRIVYRVNDDQEIRQLTRFSLAEGRPQKAARREFRWGLGSKNFKAGDFVQYWAISIDRNSLTGPGLGQSRKFSISIVSPGQVMANLEVAMDDYAAVLEELIRLQRENRAQTASGVAFETLTIRETKIRTGTAVLARAMKQSLLPVKTMAKKLDGLYTGLMADVIRVLESGRDTKDAAKKAARRNDSLPMQDEIITQLTKLLNRLQKNEKARKVLRRLRRKDKPAHQAISKALAKLVKDLDRVVDDQTKIASDFEKMPKKKLDELKETDLDAKKIEAFKQKWSKWRKGTIDELTKLPTGFVDDFGMRKDVNRVFEEIEKVAKRSKSSKIEVALEDAGSSKATEMLEDLETWMPDAADSLKWMMEEPLNQKPMKMPEMPLPDALEDLIGELLQEAEEFDEEADDMTSAWGDNLNQAGWGVSDGPISNFSAKGKTGNDLPNKNEVTGRAGDGRRGKSSGQMVGDTARGLKGRKTPARLNNERYEPGKLKEEGRLDPAGATGGGKKAGEGRRGLQGGTPPDFVKDMKRLNAKQMGIREKAERIARKVDTTSVMGRRLKAAIKLMKSVETDLRDLRYEEAARKRRIAMRQLRIAFKDLDRSTTVQLHRARELPARLRRELLQSADEGYPKGYEALLQRYFRALSKAEK